jgi:hypothetical protein
VQVGASLVEKTEAEGGADVLFVSLDGAELDAGAAEGFVGSEAAALQIFGSKVDVGTEFGFNVGLDGVAMKK